MVIHTDLILMGAVKEHHFPVFQFGSIQYTATVVVESFLADRVGVQDVPFGLIARHTVDSPDEIVSGFHNLISIHNFVLLLEHLSMWGTLKTVIDWAEGCLLNSTTEEIPVEAELVEAYLIK
jgi:hypothetical protein